MFKNLNDKGNENVKIKVYPSVYKVEAVQGLLMNLARGDLP